MPFEPDSVPQRPRRRRRWAVAAVAAIGLVLLAIWVGPPTRWRWLQDAMYGPDASSVSCSFAADIHGANSAQDGLIRCYLSALAHHSSSQMRSVVRATDDNGPASFSAYDFAHSADARSGIPKVTVTGNDVDSADASVSIHYADGTRDDHEIHLANPGSSHSLRFWDIGTDPSGPSASPTAAP